MIFIGLLVIWFLERIVYVDTAKKKKKEGVKNSTLIKGMISATFLFSIFMSIVLRTTTVDPMSYTEGTGIIFLILGLSLRYWTYYFIKPYFSRMISPYDSRPLYSKGPFRFTRHPFHTGFFLNTAGLCLFISGHWISLLITFIFVGSALHYRMEVEENMYTEKYGEIYTYWCKHRFRILPFIY